MMKLREVRGGLERFIFDLPTAWLVPLAERYRDNEALLRRYFLDAHYTISPRPDLRDVISHTIRVLGQSSEVTLVIRRGHYSVLDMIRAHKEVTLREDGSVVCSCHPDAIFWIVKESLPDYSRQFEDGVIWEPEPRQP